ncbi:glutathione S-transferase F4 [Striga asiatica]|uniref:Glutathione S-transferase F4 n=1 Tax=Striga asiatica TaxID=4170 RepID=A0A5A7P505_STRAF|nr:glutathione S-transferase F4 [Striga asiatica]
MPSRIFPPRCIKISIQSICDFLNLRGVGRDLSVGGLGAAARLMIVLFTFSPDLRCTHRDVLAATIIVMAHNAFCHTAQGFDINSQLTFRSTQLMPTCNSQLAVVAHSYLPPLTHCSPRLTFGSDFSMVMTWWF